jgi:hypothetical protein
MNKPHRGVVAVGLSLALAILACSPVGGGTKSSTPTPAAAGNTADTATPAPAGGNAAVTDTPQAAGGGQAAETPTATYDAISAQLTVPPLLTANAATATAATGSLRQWAAAAQASSQYGDTNYAATHATGAPDGPTDCSDNGAAWASAGNASQDNIQLVYTTTVVPVAINIYENNKPGAIVKVEVDEANGTAHTVYSGQSLVSQQCPRIFTVGITSVQAHVNRVKIYLDQSVTASWDEIDAVELVGNP